MATPPTAETFALALDPHEVLDFVIDLSGVLEDGEEVASYTLNALAEAAALGLTIIDDDDGRDHALEGGNRSIRFWLTVDGAFQGNAAFNGEGVSLPLEVVIETNSDPSRTRDRTFLVKVAQQ